MNSRITDRLRLPRFCLQLAVIVAMLCHAGCASGGDDTEPASLRVGVLPDQDASELQSVHGPLIDYLGATTGLELELVIPDSYDRLVELFADGDLQLVWFGGLTFLQAERFGAQPLVMRDLDLEFTTDFLVAASSSGDTIEDFAGGKLGFGPPLSTSGHLMPRFFLTERGLDPERFFGSLVHSQAHDETARWVRDRVVVVGAVNSRVVEAMQNDGRLSPSDVRVIWRTPPYRNYVWATVSDLAPTTRSLLLNAFLALELSDPSHAEILRAQAAKAYVPASRSDYEALRRAAGTVRSMDGGTGP